MNDKIERLTPAERLAHNLAWPNRPVIEKVAEAFRYWHSDAPLEEQSFRVKQFAEKNNLDAAALAERVGVQIEKSFDERKEAVAL